MPKLSSAKDVSYLSFQGGGGLGFSYIGAIRALEKMQVLPVRRGGQVKGISGTSAGAITALLLATGASAKDLEEVFSDKARFETFYDDPRKGTVRALKPGDFFASATFSDRESLTEDIATATAKAVELYLSLQKGAASLLLESVTQAGPLSAPLLAIVLALSLPGSFSISKKMQAEYPFIKKLATKPIDYLFNLLYDRGLFPGFAVRDFLRNIIRQRFSRIQTWAQYPRLRDASEINFSMFKDITGVDLKVCGTNISQRRTILFSAENTPEFPVVEAVGMSACFPIAFKPIYIKSPPTDKILGPLRGLYVDGGVLNNIPVHAFDSAPKRLGTFPALNPGMLAFRLREGAPRSEDNYRDPEGDADPLASFAGDLLSTLLMPGRDGQFRTAAELDQSIDLFTFGLSLFDFAPSPYTAKNPIEEAEREVARYFRTK